MLQQLSLLHTRACSQGHVAGKGCWTQVKGGTKDVEFELYLIAAVMASFGIGILCYHH